MKAKTVLDAINETIEDLDSRERKCLEKGDLKGYDHYASMAEAMRWFADVMYDKTGYQMFFYGVD